MPLQFVPWVIAALFAVIVIAIIVWQVTTRRKRVTTSTPLEPSQAEVTLNVEHQEPQADSATETDTSEPTDRN